MIITLGGGRRVPPPTPSGGGGGASTIPNIWPNDGTYGHVWAGANNTARSSILTTWNGVTPCLTSGAGPTFAAGAGPNGIDAAKVDWVTGAGDQGSECLLNIGGSRREVYYREFTKLSAAPNNTVKGVRFYHSDFSKQLGTPGFDYNSTPGALTVAYGRDNWADGHTPDEGPLNAAIIGSYFNYESYINFTDPHHYIGKVWINDVLKIDMDYDVSALTPDPTTVIVGFLELMGTINAPLVAGTRYSTMIGVSSQKMGIPPGYTFP